MWDDMRIMDVNYLFKKNIYDIDLGVEFFLWLNFIFGILNVEVWYLLSWIEIFLLLNG